MKSCKAVSLLSVFILQSLYSVCSAFPSGSEADVQLNLWNNATNWQTERRLEDCTVGQAIATDEYRGGITAKGIFFTFQAAQDAQLLSLEFAVSKDAEQTVPVQIYFREGSFSGVSGRDVEWKMVADTSAQLSPDGYTAIVPVLNFQTSALKANTEYALYISMQTSGLLYSKLSNAGIGSVSMSDGVIERRIGVLTNEGPFPQSLANAEIAEFMGVLHYTATQACSAILQVTKVDLLFGINDIPDTDNLNELSSSFGEAVNALFVTTTTLSESKRENMINVNGTDANFKGRSDVCPDSFEICALVATSAYIEHLPRVTSGQIQRLILDEAIELASLVKRLSSHSVDIVYVGGAEATLLTALSFQGVPSLMDDTQQRYFELVYTEFLQGLITDMDIHEVSIVSQKQTARRRALRGVEGHDEDHRSLQSATVETTMNVYGIGGTADELRALVFDAVLGNADTLIRSLKLEGLRPSFLVLEPEVNVNPAFFTGLQAIKVAIPDMSDSGGTDGTGGTDTTTSESEETPSWQIILGAVGVALSTLFILYRIYKDCFHQEKYLVNKLSRGESNAPSYHSAAINSRKIPQEQFEDEIVEQPDFEEVEVVAKPDFEEVVDKPPPPPSPAPPARGLRSRSLEPSQRFGRQASPDEGSQARGRGRSNEPKRPMSQEKLLATSSHGAPDSRGVARSRSSEGLVRPGSREAPSGRGVARSRSSEGLIWPGVVRSMSQEGLSRMRTASQEGLRQLLPQPQERLRSRSQEGLGERGPLMHHPHDPAGAAQRYLQQRNQMMSQSAHDPRTPPGGRGRGGRGPGRGGRGPRPRSHDRFQQKPRSNTSLQNSNSSLGHDAQDESEVVSDVEDSESTFAAESAPPSSSKLVTHVVSNAQHGNVTKFKDNQMALYSPEDGSGVQLVQIIQMQAVKGKTNIPCYKIRLQGSNDEKTMVKETLLMELGEAATSPPPVTSPSGKVKKSPKILKKKASDISATDASATSSKKKKKKKVPKDGDASVPSPETGKSPKIKKKKAAADKSPTPEGKSPKTKKKKALKKTGSLEDLQMVKAKAQVAAKKEPTRGVRRSSSWDGLAAQKAAASLDGQGHASFNNTGLPNGQQLFKLPRRKPSQERPITGKPASQKAANDDSSVESALNSPVAKKSTKDKAKQAAARSAIPAPGGSSSEESDLEEKA